MVAQPQTDPITRQNFYQRALQFTEKFGNKEKTLPVISPGSPEFNAWQQYFQRHLGWTPLILRFVLDGSRREMTMPTKFPQIFDPDFVEDQKWVPPPVVHASTDRSSRPTLEELRKRYGPNWGIKNMTDVEDRRLVELRERRARQQVEARQRMIERQWAKEGQDPVYASQEERIVISPSLVAAVKNSQE